MDRPRATRESVFKACDELLLSGQYPSARAVVAITKGSLSTVGPLRDEWWRLLALNYRDGKFLKGIPREVSEFLTGIWSSASDLAAKTFETRAAELNQAIADQAREIEASRAAQAALQADLARSHDHAHQLTTRLEERAASEKLHAERHFAEIQALRDQLRASIDSNERLSSDAKAASETAAKQLATASDAASEERRRLMMQVDAARQESVRLAELSAAAAERHNAAVQSLTTRLEAAQSQIEHLTRELMTVRQQSASDATRLESSQALNFALREERDRLASSLSAAEEVIASQAASGRALNSVVESLKEMMHTPSNSKVPRTQRRTLKSDR